MPAAGVWAVAIAGTTVVGGIIAWAAGRPGTGSGGRLGRRLGLCFGFGEGDPVGEGDAVEDVREREHPQLVQPGVGRDAGLLVRPGAGVDVGVGGQGGVGGQLWAWALSGGAGSSEHLLFAMFEDSMRYTRIL